MHDGGELGRRSGADQFADRHEMRTDNAVERRSDIGVAEIDRRDPGVGLRLQQVGLGIVAIGRGLVESRLRNRLTLHQIRLPLVVGLGLLERSLGAGFRRLRLVEF